MGLGCAHTIYAQEETQSRMKYDYDKVEKEKGN